MNDDQLALQKTLEASLVFARKHVGSFPIRPGKNAPHLQTLITEADDVVAAMKARHAGQTGGQAAASTTTKAAQRKLLKRKIRRLAEAMIPISKERKDPALLELFRVGNISVDAGVTARANAFAEAIDAHGLGDILADLGFSETPADALRTEAKRFAETKDDQSEAQQERVGDTASLAELERTGRIVLGKMNTLVQNTFETQPALLAAWDAASRIVRHAGGSEAPPAAPENGSATPPPAAG